MSNRMISPYCDQPSILQKLENLQCSINSLYSKYCELLGRSMDVDLQMRVDSESGEIQYSINGGPWTNIINISELTGPDGKSAYQIWLDLGNTGTEQDFIDYLKAGVNYGENGEIPFVNNGGFSYASELGSTPFTYDGLSVKIGDINAPNPSSTELILYPDSIEFIKNNVQAGIVLDPSSPTSPVQSQHILQNKNGVLAHLDDIYSPTFLSYHLFSSNNLSTINNGEIKLDFTNNSGKISLRSLENLEPVNSITEGSFFKFKKIEDTLNFLVIQIYEISFIPGSSFDFTFSVFFQGPNFSPTLGDKGVYNFQVDYSHEEPNLPTTLGYGYPIYFESYTGSVSTDSPYTLYYKGDVPLNTMYIPLHTSASSDISNLIDKIKVGDYFTIFGEQSEDFLTVKVDSIDTSLTTHLRITYTDIVTGSFFTTVNRPMFISYSPSSEAVVFGNSGSTQVENISVLTSSEYGTLVSTSLTDPNTLYFTTL